MDQAEEKNPFFNNYCFIIVIIVIVIVIVIIVLLLLVTVPPRENSATRQSPQICNILLLNIVTSIPIIQCLNPF